MSSELKMAIPSDLLEIIIDYLYTDTITSKCKFFFNEIRDIQKPKDCSSFD